MILLATVHRSFTHSVFAMLKEENRGEKVIRLHIWPKGILEARTGNYRVMITYRNPRDVANSWAKRSHVWRSGLWCAQWEALVEAAPLAEKIYRIEDLDRQLGSYGQYGIKRNTRAREIDVQYAENICREVFK